MAADKVPTTSPPQRSKQEPETLNYRSGDNHLERSARPTHASPESASVYYPPSLSSMLTPNSLISYQLALGGTSMPSTSTFPSALFFQQLQQQQLQAQPNPTSSGSSDQVADVGREVSPTRPQSSCSSTPKCEHCWKTFTSARALALHMPVHMPDTSRCFKCKKCNAGFKTSQGQKIHQHTCLRKALTSTTNKEPARHVGRPRTTNNSNKRMRTDTGSGSETTCVPSEKEEIYIEEEVVSARTTKRTSANTHARFRDKTDEDSADSTEQQRQSQRRIRFGLDAAKQDASADNNMKMPASTSCSKAVNAERIPNVEVSKLKQTTEFVDACLELMGSGSVEGQISELKPSARLAIRAILQQNVLPPLMSTLADIAGGDEISGADVVQQGLPAAPKNVTVADVVDGLESFKIVCEMFEKLAVPEVLGQALSKPALLLSLSIIKSVIHIFGSQ